MLMILDVFNHSILYKRKVVRFTRMEFSFMLFLIERRNSSPFQTDEIIEYIWKDRSQVIINNNLNQLSYKVRKKISKLDDFLTLEMKRNKENRIVNNKRVIILTLKSRLLAKVITRFYKEV